MKKSSRNGEPSAAFVDVILERVKELFPNDPQFVVAQRVGINPSYWSNIIRRRVVPPSLQKILNIAAALDINPDELAHLAGYSIPSLQDDSLWAARREGGVRPTDTIAGKAPHMMVKLPDGTWINPKYVSYIRKVGEDTLGDKTITTLGLLPFSGDGVNSFAFQGDIRDELAKLINAQEG